VLLQGDADGVRGDVQGVHDPGSRGLEVTVALGALDRDVRVVAVHQVAGVAEGPGHLGHAAIGPARGWPAGAAQALSDRVGDRAQSGDGFVAVVRAGADVMPGQAAPQVGRGRDEVGPAVQESAGVVAGNVHQQVARRVVDVEEQLAEGADVRGGERYPCGVEERVVDVGVGAPAPSIQGRVPPGSGRTGR
jgi:hypothetical protein